MSSCDRCGSPDGKFTVSTAHDGITLSEVSVCSICLKLVLLGPNPDPDTAAILDELMSRIDRCHIREHAKQ